MASWAGDVQVALQEALDASNAEFEAASKYYDSIAH